MCGPTLDHCPALFRLSAACVNAKVPRAVGGQ